MVPWSRRSSLAAAVSRRRAGPTTPSSPSSSSSPPSRRMRRRPAADDPHGYGLFQPSNEVWRAWRVSHAVAAALRAPAVLFQCPPSFRPEETSVAYLRSFLAEARNDVGEQTALVW